MGLFDLFGRESKDKKNDYEKVNRGYYTAAPSTETKKDGPIAVFAPNSFIEVENIIDSFKNGKNTVVHLTKIKSDTAIRILDMLSGAIYALGGGVYEMDKNVFMFSPAGVEIK